MKHHWLFFLAACMSTSLADAGDDPPTNRDLALRSVQNWDFDEITSATWQQKGGKISTAVGIRDDCAVFDGKTVIVARQSERLTHHQDGTSLVFWFNPYELGGNQQVLAGKSRYSLNEREWTVMVDRDKKLRLYVRQGAWKTAEATRPLRAGHWHQLGVVFRTQHAELWLNGNLADTVKLTSPVPRTRAPLTFGGVDDDGRVWQNFRGAIDDASLFDRALDATEMKSLYHPILATHKIPSALQPVPLWDERQTLPVAKKIPSLSGVTFHVIKKWDRPTDGYTFLHGVGLGWHKGKLYASFGHNKGAENTVTEEAHYRVSEDDGRTWSDLRVIDAGDEEELAISHGVFLSHRGKLWAFHGAYYDKMRRIHTRAYSLDEATGQWLKHGTVVRNGFWPMNQPQRLANGNWIMPGISAGPYSNGRVFPAAVAISHGDDFRKWDYVQIPTDDHISRMWGESAIFIDGKRIYNIARYGGTAVALAAISRDYGRTWQPSRLSNLPMATSKPAAGTLSTGQRYLICTIAANNGGTRSPLTIALSSVGKSTFRSVFVVRRSQLHDGAGESADRLRLSYPCAVEHEGKLYVGYSNDGGRGRNQNSAELAIIPLEELNNR